MFKSYFLAGFECATGYNANGEWIDQIVATEHDRFADEDYRLLAAAGLLATREGMRWPLVDRGGKYDFTPSVSRLEAGSRYGIEIIWDLFHYGYPEELDPFSDEFVTRFADYCYAAARFVASRTEGTCYFTPVNEPSYFAFAGGEAALFAPHQRGRAWDLKVNLVRAAIQGIDAIRAACPGARIVNADPLCHVAAPVDRPDLQPEADHFNNSIVFESWDMLCGKLLPELGGSRDHLDIPGINYYWTNQWELTRVGVPLKDLDPRRWSLRHLVRSVWERYGGELIISETSHRDEMRSVWLRELADECDAILDDGIPLEGVCLYPVLGMPEWHAQHVWTRMGLWDLFPGDGCLDRVVCGPAMEALREAQRLDRRLRKHTHELVLAA